MRLHILDISQPRKVVEFANSFVESEQGVDVLVNNAGAMVNQRELNEEGLEKNFSTNTLGKTNIACFKINSGCLSAGHKIRDLKMLGHFVRSTTF